MPYHMTEQAISYRKAVEKIGLLAKLGEFQVEIAGAAPLGLSVAHSDIDVLCFSSSPEPLERAIWHEFGQEKNFSLRRWAAGEKAIIATFTAHGWTFQIYGSNVPVREQIGWKLYQAEIRLLALGGQHFKSEVMRLRSSGMKTIPAMMRVLGRDGDPYAALIATGNVSDERLKADM
ncbi:DUF4269 domain-containing protein [Novosphingobium terrae]|uniref:DUF4269 domain-containing protein n=1 Tax=Novosphingobium terrae TaxID=2726189 RepID=UPI00197F6658|nr:DUF4269 domain-containing protein [Novosphingobium terrae]